MVSKPEILRRLNKSFMGSRVFDMRVFLHADSCDESSAAERIEGLVEGQALATGV